MSKKLSNSVWTRPRICLAVFAVLCGAMPLAAQTNADGSTEPVAPPVTSFLDVVIQGIGYIGPVILLLSVAMAYLIIEHFWTIRGSTMNNEAEIRETRELIENRKFRDCVKAVSDSRSMFGDVLTIGLRHGRHGFEAMQEAVEERANAWRSRLFRKVELLNIIGNISPLLGLLGTVTGMIQAFGQMQATQGAYGPEELAGGISLALVSTFLGLIVAIFALFFFGICRNRVDSMTVAAQAAVIDTLEYFRPSPQSVVPGTGSGKRETAAADA